MKNRTYFFLLLLAATPAVSAPKSVASREEIEPLVLHYEELNDKCRGGSGDNPATETFCTKRDAIGSKIESAGWCWGDESQYESDKQWQLCVAVPGQPSELWPAPRFDVQATCDVISNASGTPSEMLRQGCYDQEQQSYNAVKALWMKIPKTMQTTCMKIATASGHGSYMMLDGCIEQEMKAQDSNQNFKFKY